MRNEPKNVGIWIRVSTEDQAKGESPKYHEERARQYAQVKEWRVVEVYHLEAVSGKSVMGHPEAQRMLTDVKTGKIKGLIFSKLARLARNTKELLEFSDYFQKYGADLVSLQESIDTSSPAGKLLYTMIAALAEWERGEIASRVQASVKVRAKLGKPLGGFAPYGYKWVDKQLQINLEEAPVRKLVFELFAEHKRVKQVTRLINEMGYRTRKGKPFSSGTIKLFLTDPVSKGIRRVNAYRSAKDGKRKTVLKDPSEWEFVKSPAIVSVELWEKCNSILNDSALRNKRSKPVKQLFSGYLFCHCGNKMYVLNETKKYICKKCRNKILIEDTEVIFEAYLSNFLANSDEIQSRLEVHREAIQEKEKELIRLEEEIEEHNDRLDKIMALYQAGEIPQRGFSKFYNPVFEQVEQKEVLVSRLKGEIDALKIQLLSSDQVVEEAKHLQKLWKTMEMQERRKIVESVLQKYIVGENDIEIIFNYLPTHLPSNQWEKGSDTRRVLPHRPLQSKEYLSFIFRFELSKCF